MPSDAQCAFAICLCVPHRPVAEAAKPDPLGRRTGTESKDTTELPPGFDPEAFAKLNKNARKRANKAASRAAVTAAAGGGGGGFGSSAAGSEASFGDGGRPGSAAAASDVGSQGAEGEMRIDDRHRALMGGGKFITNPADFAALLGSMLSSDEEDSGANEGGEASDGYESDHDGSREDAATPLSRDQGLRASSSMQAQDVHAAATTAAGTGAPAHQQQQQMGGGVQQQLGFSGELVITPTAQLSAGGHHHQPQQQHQVSGVPAAVNMFALLPNQQRQQQQQPMSGPVAIQQQERFVSMPIPAQLQQHHVLMHPPIQPQIPAPALHYQQQQQVQFQHPAQALPSAMQTLQQQYQQHQQASAATPYPASHGAYPAPAVPVSAGVPIPLPPSSAAAGFAGMPTTAATTTAGVGHSGSTGPMSMLRLGAISGAMQQNSWVPSPVVPQPPASVAPALAGGYHVMPGAYPGHAGIRGMDVSAPAGVVLQQQQQQQLFVPGVAVPAGGVQQMLLAAGGAMAPVTTSTGVAAVPVAHPNFLQQLQQQQQQQQLQQQPLPAWYNQLAQPSANGVSTAIAAAIKAAVPLMASNGGEEVGSGEDDEEGELMELTQLLMGAAS